MSISELRATKRHRINSVAWSLDSAAYYRDWVY